MRLSRRCFVLSLTATAFARTAARAQDDVWREYRPADLPYRIEMPGEPKVGTDDDELKNLWVRTADVQVDYEQTTFGVRWTEWKNTRTIEAMSAQFRDDMRRAEMPVTRDTPLTINGFPAREFVRQSDLMNYIARHVSMGKQTAQVSAFGDDSIHHSVAVRRFFDSFALLRSR